jgi:hypothetical protein
MTAPVPLSPRAQYRYARFPTAREQCAVARRLCRRWAAHPDARMPALHGGPFAVAWLCEWTRVKTGRP